MNHVKTFANQFYELSLVKCHALVYEFTLINYFTMFGHWTRDLDRKALATHASICTLRQHMSQGSTDPLGWVSCAI